MDRRQSPRITALLPVRVWGVDAHSLPFIQLAKAKNISNSGAVIQGIQRQVRAGEVLEVQFGDIKAEFRVVWVGKSGTERQGEIGIENLPSEPCIWDLNLCHCMEFVGNG